MTEERINVVFHPDANTSYKYTLPDVVSISENTINKDLANHSTKYLWFASLHARLIARRDYFNNELKELLANTEISYRTNAEQSGKKTTEAGIKAMIDSDPSVATMRRHLLEMENEVAMCGVIKDAFFHQQNCLVALGANLRQELKSLSTDSIRE